MVMAFNVGPMVFSFMVWDEISMGPIVPCHGAFGNLAIRV